MAISQQLQERIEAVAVELRKELYGPKGYPPWGTKFVAMEQEQAEAEGHPAGKCGGCGEPIPFDEVAGRLLQARRGDVAWQESFGRCKRCRKAFFPALPSFGNRAG